MKKRPPLFERLKTGLEEALLHAQGKLALPETTLAVSDLPAPPNYSAKEIVALREKLGLTQRGFANVLHVSVKTVQGWEQGVRTPSGIAARFLQMMQEPRTFKALFEDEPSPPRRSRASNKAAG